MLLVGELALVLGTWRIRMSGLADAAMSAADSNERAIGNSMFDWPLATHTSPTSTSLLSTEFLPETLSAAGFASAFMLDRFTFHTPPLATVETFFPLNSTVTFSPSSAQPHTGTAMPC